MVSASIPFFFCFAEGEEEEDEDGEEEDFDEEDEEEEDEEEVEGEEDDEEVSGEDEVKKLNKNPEETAVAISQHLLFLIHLTFYNSCSPRRKISVRMVKWMKKMTMKMKMKTVCNRAAQTCILKHLNPLCTRLLFPHFKCKLSKCG